MSETQDIQLDQNELSNSISTKLMSAKCLNEYINKLIEWPRRHLPRPS